MKQARIIVGANYGDEGKGTVVANYTKAAVLRGDRVLNVLTNGGSQRGHSIITDTGDSHTFKHFGSGLVYGADTLFSEYYIVNPMQFQKERYEHNVNAYIVYMHKDCKWTTPYDALYNMCIEHARGKDRHGTCAMGIWNTIERYETFAKRTLSFREFVGYCIGVPEIAKNYLKSIRAYYDAKGVPFVDEDTEVAWKSDSMMEHFMQDCIHMYNKVITIDDDWEALNLYDEVIFENGQGLQLMNMGERSTPSNTGIFDAMQILSGFANVSLHYVTRPYVTKHGYGSFNDEQDKKFIASDINEDRTNHYNEWQGDFRFGKLDLNDLSHRLYRDYNKYESLYQTRFSKTLELTHCDEMDRVNECKTALHNFKVNTYATAKV